MNVLVTGSSRGIGRAIAVRLAPYGGTVVINYLQNEHKAEETAELVRAAGDRLVEGGSIIGLSSLGSRRHVPGYAAMGAAKGALEALTRQLAVELAVRKVRVNTVCGGLVDTDALDYFPDKDKLIETANLLTPLGRIGQPDDIAKAVELLLLPQASWITGQVLVADGGWSII